MVKPFRATTAGDVLAFATAVIDLPKLWESVVGSSRRLKALGDGRLIWPVRGEAGEADVVESGQAAAGEGEIDFGDSMGVVLQDLLQLDKQPFSWKSKLLELAAEVSALLQNSDVSTPAGEAALVAAFNSLPALQGGEPLLAIPVGMHAGLYECVPSTAPPPADMVAGAETLGFGQPVERGAPVTEVTLAQLLMVADGFVRVVRPAATELASLGGPHRAVYHGPLERDAYIAGSIWAS